MSNPFNELKAPKRSGQEIDFTYKQIEKKLSKKKKWTVWQNSGLLVAIAAIIYFFIASNTLPLSNQTAAGASDIQSIHYIDTIITDNFGEIEKWYYIDTVKVRGKQFDIASQLVDRVNRGDKLPGTVNSIPQSDAFIVKYNDGTVRKYQVEYTVLSTLNIVNITTSQFAEFTPEEYSALIYEPKDWPIYVKMILDGIAIFIYFTYLSIAQKLSPNIRYHFDGPSKILLKLVGLWIFMGTLQYLTLAFFPGINILFSAAVITVVFVGRLLREHYDTGQFKRNVLEVPLSIVVYIIIFFLLNVQ